MLRFHVEQNSIQTSSFKRKYKNICSPQEVYLLVCMALHFCRHQFISQFLEENSYQFQNNVVTLSSF